MVRPDKVRGLVTCLRDALSDLRRYRERATLESLRGDRDLQNMVLHAIYIACQASIDLAVHAVADADLPTPAVYRDAFPRLADAGVIDRALADRLAGWAGLRNIVAHHYPVVLWNRVFEALRDDLGDLEAFEQVASSWLDPPRGEGT